MQPTQEQLQALEKFKFRRSLKIAAFAGAGKTSTLSLLAKSRQTRGAYLAFNKSIAEEAKTRFPDTVDCRTTHSMAYHAVMSAHRFSGGQMNNTLTSNQLAELFDLKSRVFGGRLRLDKVQQAHLMLRTVRRYCQSADINIYTQHVPQYGRLLGLSNDIMNEVRAWSVDAARSLWKDMTNPRNGQVPLGHDGYLKLWALGRPKLGFDYILLDEAQDTNPAVLGVLHDQDAQIVYVGDKHQQIYEWRGAVNAMAMIEGCEEATLSQSFRFGPAIASEASKVLRTLGERIALRGNDAVVSRIVHSGNAKTILARTNATVFAEALDALRSNLRPYIVGGTDELKRLLRDVFNLQRGEPATSPEFFGFTNWAAVVAFADTEEGEDLRTFVQLVEQHGPNALYAAIKNAQTDERSADLTLSTAHKAKGREWPSVRLASDFLSSRISATNPDTESEVRLFYVAMTRAKEVLSVEPEMLATFTSGAWKTRRPDQESPSASRSRPAPPHAPVRRPTPIVERAAPSVTQRHPASATSPSPGHPIPPKRTQGANESSIPARPQPQTHSQPWLPPMPPPEPPSLWKRIGRLFTGQ